MTKCETNESEMSETISVEIKFLDLAEYEKFFEIYPNPADNILHISTNEKINEVEIYNIVGVSMFKAIDNVNNIDITDLFGGIYIVKIRTDKAEIIKRIIKKWF